ncbi:PP2C family protein-serine/threonine phosphatase [Streptomyces alkaliterrae]|nr:PP2C family protein-serine/threonine phosphatase [Streptomyces alkaliterrae]
MPTIRTAAPDTRSTRPVSLLTNRMLVAGLIGLTLLAVLLGAFADEEWRHVPFLVFLPAFTAGIGTVRQTGIAAAWVVLAESAALLHRPLPAVSANVAMLSFSVVLSALSIVGCGIRIRQQQEINRLRSVSAALQRQMLRPLPVRLRDVTVDGVYEPVEEDSMVGGDVYEVVESPFGVRLLIADVQGKGLPALGAAFAVLMAFREAAQRERELADVAVALDEAVARYNAYAKQQERAPERFVTALLLCFAEGRAAELVNCGHIPPYHVRAGRAEPLPVRETGLPLGLGALADEPRVAEPLPSTAEGTLVLCTDGVTEARGPDGTFYPLHSRLRALAATPADGLAAALDQDLHGFAGDRLRDDVALLTVRTD